MEGLERIPLAVSSKGITCSCFFPFSTFLEIKNELLIITTLKPIRLKLNGLMVWSKSSWGCTLESQINILYIHMIIIFRGKLPINTGLF